MLEKRFGSLAQAREKFKTCLRVNPRNAKVYQARLPKYPSLGMQGGGITDTIFF